MTAKMNRVTEQVDVWEDPKDMPTSFDKPFPMSLRRAIRYFEEVEAQCDLTIQEQDALIRQVTMRLPEAIEVNRNGGAYLPMSGQAQPRTEVRASDLPYEEYRAISRLANRVIEKQMPMATRRFMSQAGRGEMDRIEELEVDIGCLRQRMRDIEHYILNHTPQSAEEVAMKLKFMASLLIDGGEIEIDLFAYLVEESADILELSLRGDAMP